MSKKYSIIYADPPWKTKYFKETRDGKLSRSLPYPVMSDTDICNLPVKDIIGDNAILFLWCIDGKIPKLSEIMSSWGFNYKTVGFVWIKKAKTTEGYNATFSSYTRKACEFCYIGTRGRYIVSKKNIDQLIVESKKAHSQKPDTARSRIVEMCGDIPRIELFARKKFDGWDSWGNEVNSDIKLL